MKLEIHAGYALRLTDGQPNMPWPDEDDADSPSVDTGDGIPPEPEILPDGASDAVVLGSTAGTVKEAAMEPQRTKEVL